MKGRLALLGAAALAGTLFVGTDSRADTGYVIAETTNGFLNTGATCSAVGVFAPAGTIFFVARDYVNGSLGNALGSGTATSTGGLLSTQAQFPIATHCDVNGDNYQIAVIALDLGTNTFLTGDVITQNCIANP